MCRSIKSPIVLRSARGEKFLAPIDTALRLKRTALGVRLAAAGLGRLHYAWLFATVQRYLQTVEHLAATIGRHAASEETNSNT